MCLCVYARLALRAAPHAAKERTFTFDFSYNSFVDRDDGEYASQALVWSDIGVGVLQNAYDGAAAGVGGPRARRLFPHSRVRCARCPCPSPLSPLLPPAGYNCSLFAYGQTGAGKSYSMMGYGEDKGIIPIACERIFDKIDGNTDDTLSIKVEASMLEIYMEKVRCSCLSPLRALLEWIA